MKLSNLHKTLIIAALAVIAIACNDMLDDIGTTLLPEQDHLTVGVDTLELTARTVPMTDVFARTRRPVLGEYIDPVFGEIKSSFIGNFFLPHGAGFRVTEGADETSIEIDSVRVVLSYTTFMGDSLLPMRLAVFPALKSLRNLENMTNVDLEAEGYVNTSVPPLGYETFTGSNRIFENVLTAGGVVRIFEIPVELPNSIGERFLTQYRRPGRGMMANTDLFNEYFPGLYFTTTFGNSTLIAVNSTSLFVHYQYEHPNGSSTYQDTIRTNIIRLNITPEVTQVNTVEAVIDHLVDPNGFPDYTFVKTPAGVKTQLVLPISQVYEKLQNQVLNLADFSVFAMPIEDPRVRLGPPTHLLLIHSDSLRAGQPNGFFERRRLPDNRTSFLSEQFDTQTFSFRFGNISTMLNHYLQEMSDELQNLPAGGELNLYYYLIPVEVGTTMTGGSMWSPGTPVLSSLHNLMWPTATRLDRRPGSMRMSLVFSDF